MARKKKIINNTPYPQHAIDAVVRCLWPDIVAFFESEEGQKEFEAWKRQQDKENMEQENQLVKGSIRKIPSESMIRLWRNFFVMADYLVRRLEEALLRLPFSK